MKKEKRNLKKLLDHDTNAKKKLREAFYKFKKGHPKLELDLKDIQNAVDALAYGAYYSPIDADLEIECLIEEDRPR